MNSKEIIRRTLEFSKPERVGRSFGDMDFAKCGNTVKTHSTDWALVAGNRWERVDEWGNLVGKD